MTAARVAPAGRDYQQTYYDEHYAHFASSVRAQRSQPMLRAFFDSLAARVLAVATSVRDDPGRPLRIYEAGCGEGFVGAALQRVAASRGLALEYTASDLSPSALELAGETVNGTLIAGDAIEVTADLPTRDFDVVFAKNLLHHIDEPAAFLREARAAVSPTGRVVVMEPRFAQPLVFLTNLPFPRRERHYFKGPGRNRTAVAASGLRLLREDPFCWFPYELACATRLELPRRVLARVRKPKTLERMLDLDERLTRRMPWWTEYYVWELALAV